METITLVIADKDPDFLYKISKYVLDRDISFDLAVFTDVNSLAEHISNKNVNILVFDENFADLNYIKNLEADRKIIMTMNLTNQNDGLYRIKKYQKFETFINEIADIYFKEEMEAIMKEINLVETDSKTFGFFSASGGTGCTTLALSLAATKSLDKESVFYINFEKYNSSTIYLTSNKQISSDFIAKILADDKLYDLEKIYKICDSDPVTGINFFPFPVIDESYYQYFHLLFETIVNSKSFKYIIIDFSSNIFNYADILELIDKKFLLLNDNLLSFRKTYLFLNDTKYDNNIELILNRNNNNHLKYQHDFDFSVMISDNPFLMNENNLLAIKNHFEEYFVDILQ